MIHDFKNFLLENNNSLRQDTTLLSEEEFNFLLENNCKDFSFDDKPIWRNISSLTDKYYLIDPTKHDRKSSFGLNYYNIIVDNLPSWEEWPKRSKSLIGLLNSFETFYGVEKYRLIPFDGAIIAKTNIRDFIGGFKKLQKFNIYLLDNINYFIKKLYQYFSLVYKDITKPIDTNINNFIYDMSIIEDKLKNMSRKQIEKLNFDEHEKILLSFYDYLVLDGKNFMDFMIYYLNPIENDFELLSYNQLKTSNIHKHGNEIWTESKCLLINEKDIQNFRKKYDK
jgi:hypothetical protein